MPQIDLKKYSNVLYDRNEVRRIFLKDVLSDMVSTWTSIVTTPSGKKWMVTSPWILDYIYGGATKDVIDQLLIQNQVCIVWFPTLADLVMYEINFYPSWSLVKNRINVPSYNPHMPVYERVIQNIPIVAVPGTHGDYALYAGKDTGADFIFQEPIQGWDIGEIIEQGLKLPHEYQSLAENAHYIGDWQGHYVFNSFKSLTYRR